ncbi:MAG TPA: serine/threonine-protein kinase [Ktedonobacteraceae bacterium]|nr:serine/threonine-protein kinase [Ktedonobacteraceae bacterium]
MASQGPLSGQRLGNKYLLGELLGSGGFGDVYKAQNLYLNRPQAIKVLLEKHFSDVSFCQRFIREAQTLAGLSHPNILPVYDFELEGNRAFLVMPFISGGTLHDILKQRGQLNLQETENYLTQICAALDYAHARNVVHLDLKPLNLLHQDGILLLSDFGLAHLMKEGAVEGGSSLRFGSPHYMAPEHLQGLPQQRSDIYALGVMLYQMLAGELPFRGTTPESIMLKHLTEPPPPLRSRRSDLPSNLEPVIGKAMAKNPAARYETAGKLLVDFKAAVSKPATQLHQSSPYNPPLAPTIPARNPSVALYNQGSLSTPNTPGVSTTQNAFRGTPYTGQPAPQKATTIGHPILRHSLIFGSILGIVSIILFYTNIYLDVGGFNIFSLLLFIFFSLFAGQGSSKKTRKIRTGIISGIYTSLIGEFIGFLSIWIQYQIFYIHGIEIIPVILLGLIGGTIGGVIGKLRSK